MKTVDEIFGEMLVCFGERTGMEVDQGCDLAVRLYAAAAQIYAMYLQADWVARQAFPQTAEGDYLDLHAQLRGLERKQASHAAGTLRFFADQAAETPREIPLGTVCMTAGLVRFETTRAAVLPVGQLQVDVPARALLAGSAGNAAAGTVLSMAVAPVGIRRCDNPEPFLGGSDGETDSELRKRVLDTFQRLPNGANAAFYEQGPSPLTRWPPPLSSPGAGGSVRWMWWCPLTADRQTRHCWSSSRPISRAAGRSPWTSRYAPRSR